MKASKYLHILREIVEMIHLKKALKNLFLSDRTFLGGRGGGGVGNDRLSEISLQPTRPARAMTNLCVIKIPWVTLSVLLIWNFQLHHIFLHTRAAKYYFSSLSRCEHFYWFTIVNYSTCGQLLMERIYIGLLNILQFF